MIAQARAKIEKSGMSNRVHFQPGNARQITYPDETFDILYNSYMFDLIPLDGFAPILTEFERVLKPGGKLVLVNMSKPDSRKTFFETIYEKKWVTTPCRPVLMSSYLEPAGFSDIQRFYRANHLRFIPLPFGTEIVVARKPAHYG